MGKKIICAILSMVLVFTISIPALAAENKTLNTVPPLSQEEKVALNQWVSYSDDNMQYVIKSGAKSALSDEEYRVLSHYITVTNSNISKADFSTNEVFIVAPEEEFQYVNARAYNEGVTKIEFHWWGASIYLSKTTIMTIGAGITIGGIWIPEGVVTKILATVGVVIALCPGGIAFDYNYIAAGISNLVPGMSILFPAVSNIRWQ